MRWAIEPADVSAIVQAVKSIERIRILSDSSFADSFAWSEIDEKQFVVEEPTFVTMAAHHDRHENPGIIVSIAREISAVGFQ